MNELQEVNNEVMVSSKEDLTNRFEVIEEGIRKNYLTRLAEMSVAPVEYLLPLEDDLIDNIRLYHITEMVYQRGEDPLDKFTTVYNTLSTYNSSVFILMDSDGKTTDLYLGVRNNEKDDEIKRSTVTIGDTLKNALIGHFPGIKIDNVNRQITARISEKISRQNNLASVSVLGNKKNEKGTDKERFVQGLEKLILSMQGRPYIGIILAENQSPEMIVRLRKSYQELYTKLSGFQRIQLSENHNESVSKSKSFSEMNGKQKAALLAGLATSVAGMAVGGVSLGMMRNVGIVGGTMVGGQVSGQLNSFINALAPNEQSTVSDSKSINTTVENKTVTDLLKMIDDELNRLHEFDSYGMWNVAGYFLSDDMSASEIAASNYRSLMNGEDSGREVSAINTWRSNDKELSGNYYDLTTALSRFIHPAFYYSKSNEMEVLTNATMAISGKELGLHLGLPRATVPGLPVIQHAEFGKEVYSYNLFGKKEKLSPEDRMTLGYVFDLGQKTDKIVELNNRSLNMHTFITGSTGSGKSNTVYQMLTELRQDKIPFLVIEPAKGEYKDVFGSLPDVNVYSTNPAIAELVHINPFRFPESIHVLEHIDGLVEIFSACWPMYDAMPAFFKEAILRSYETVGWDLGSSSFDGDTLEYPDFEILTEQLDKLIDESGYASDIKSNYRGALITRVKSLTVGLNKFIFTTEQTPYEALFDENCILDISRVKSTETKALIMGIMVYILNEYRMDHKTSNNNGLKHITVLEEAHNLLKNTTSTGEENNLISKSVEMITQTIAEIRTYGEGFIIVDQSPSSVDIAAIKNTNTKIVLRTPEANDREAVGRSIGLTEDQVNEIAKLPSGVAVVYQNNWVSPVLTMINQAPVSERPYINPNPKRIMPVREARTAIITALMQPWLNKPKIHGKELNEAVKVLDLSREVKMKIMDSIDDYLFLNGNMVWNDTDIPVLQETLMALLTINDRQFDEFLINNDAEGLRSTVMTRTIGLSENDVEKICYILTKVVE